MAFNALISNLGSNRNKIQKSEQLTEDDIQFIMANTDFDREKVIKWYDDFIKKCPQGKMNKRQFVDFYKKLIKGEHPDEDKFCEAVFEVFDSDGNGTVDFAEFLIAFWVRARGSVKEKLAWLFDVYDCDKSGHITLSELNKMLKLVLNMKGIKEDPYSLSRKIMEAWDRSHDGKISKPEFIAGCTNDAKMRALFAPF